MSAVEDQDIFESRIMTQKVENWHSRLTFANFCNNSAQVLKNQNFPTIQPLEFFSHWTAF